MSSRDADRNQSGGAASMRRLQPARRQVNKCLKGMRLPMAAADASADACKHKNRCIWFWTCRQQCDTQAARGRTPYGLSGGGAAAQHRTRAQEVQRTFAPVLLLGLGLMAAARAACAACAAQAPRAASSGEQTSQGQLKEGVCSCGFTAVYSGTSDGGPPPIPQTTIHGTRGGTMGAPCNVECAGLTRDCVIISLSSECYKLWFNFPELSHGRP